MKQDDILMKQDHSWKMNITTKEDNNQLML